MKIHQISALVSLLARVMLKLDKYVTRANA